MSEVANSFKRLTDAFARIPATTRTILILVVVLALTGGIYTWAAGYAKDSRYEPLFSGLDSRDAAEITQKLTQQKVAYKISGDGSTILVPSSIVLSTRLSLTAEGLPRGGVVGFELMDKVSLGATDFDRRVNYLRALTGELTRTIRQIDGVEDARVHIVIPENNYFVSKARPATAAVFLKLRSRFELSKPQIKGIVNLIARSVEGLNSEDVAVIDMQGRLLSGDAAQNSADALGAAFTQNLDVQQSFQMQLETSLQTLLERVLGPGNVVTKVTAELNFDRKTIDKRLFQPATDGILRSVQELEETFKGQGNAPSGVPGTTSNIPQYQSGSSGNSDYQKKESTKNYEISEIKEQTVVAPGSVKRLSVAVVVNKDLEDTVRQAIEKTVSAAIGYDIERKDVVTVSSMVFNNTLLDSIKKQMEDEKKASLAPKFALNNTVLMGAGGALVLMLLIIVIVGARRRRQAARLARLAEIGQPAQRAALRPVDVAEALAQVAQASALEEMAAPPKTLDPEQEKRRKLREEIDKVARQNPENVAQLIRTWLSEERR